jgi:hypothetical protein
MLALYVLWLSRRRTKRRRSQFRQLGHAWQWSRAQYTIARLILVVAVAALLLTPISRMGADLQGKVSLGMMFIGAKLFASCAVVAQER